VLKMVVLKMIRRPARFHRSNPGPTTATEKAADPHAEAESNEPNIEREVPSKRRLTTKLKA
jgi:hypothetical protein